MSMLSKEEFKKLYIGEVYKVIPYINQEIIKELAKHNIGWNQSIDNYKEYLIQSYERYYLVYETAYSRGVKTIIDVGGFWAVFPITMSKLGFKVYMSEALKYYSNNYNSFFEFVKSQNVEIIDFDPFDEIYSDQSFDMVTVMAVIEHYPHSLHAFFDNIKRMMHSSSIMCLDVPNIAYIKNRIGFLFGLSPLTSIKSIYNSAVPFIGHHHEYTFEELKELMEIIKLNICRKKTFNYSRGRLLNWGNIIKNPIILSNLFFENTREVIYIEAVK